MMQRREVSGRKAATQALQVIAESIRASRGRRGKETPATGKTTPNAQGSSNDMKDINKPSSLAEDIVKCLPKQEAREEINPISQFSNANKENQNPTCKEKSKGSNVLSESSIQGGQLDNNEKIKTHRKPGRKPLKQKETLSEKVADIVDDDAIQVNQQRPSLKQRNHTSEKLSTHSPQQTLTQRMDIYSTPFTQETEKLNDPSSTAKKDQTHSSTTQEQQLQEQKAFLNNQQQYQQLSSDIKPSVRDDYLEKNRSQVENNDPNIPKDFHQNNQSDLNIQNITYQNVNHNNDQSQTQNSQQLLTLNSNINQQNKESKQQTQKQSENFKVLTNNEMNIYQNQEKDNKNLEQDQMSQSKEETSKKNTDQEENLQMMRDLDYVLKEGGDEDDEVGLTDQSIDENPENDNINSSSAAGQGNTGSTYQGRWTQEEHDKFIEGLRLYGKDWRRIEEYIGSRSCAQIRSHAQKYFNRLQRDIARGIKRNDEMQMSFALGKKKRRHQQQQQQSGGDEETSVQSSMIQKKQKTDNVSETNQTRNSKEIMSYLTTQTPNIQTELPPLLAQTNQQIQQIQETLQKLTDDELVLQMKQLIAQREQISLEVLLQKISRDIAGQYLIQITNKFHLLAMQALQQCKFDICNRLIDERNLTQFVCILLSRQVTISPIQEQQSEQITGQGNKASALEIVQRVELSPRSYPTAANQFQTISKNPDQTSQQVRLQQQQQNMINMMQSRDQRINQDYYKNEQ